MQRMVILLAGGGGTRLFPYTTVLPKPLLPIQGKQILAYIIEDLYKARIDKFVVAISEEQKKLFENYLGEAEYLTYLSSPEEYNTAGRLKEVIECLDVEDDFLLHYGDIITNLDYRQLWEYHAIGDAIATLVVKRGWKIPKGLVRSDEDGKVTEFIERYPLDEDIWTGIAMLSSKVFEYIESPYEDIGADILPKLVESGEPVKIFQFDGFFLDIGTQRDYLSAVEYLKSQRYL